MNTKQLYLDMFSKLNKITDIPIGEWSAFEKCLRTDIIKKHQNIFMQNDSDLRIYFVISGLAYSSYQTKDGELAVKKFYWAGRIIASWSSFHVNQPCAFSCTTIQDTIVVSIPAKTYKEFERRHNCWLRLSQHMTLNALVDNELREYESLTLSSKERYKQFIHRHIEIAAKIPQRLIALYLGITPVSLSRLKSKIN